MADECRDISGHQQLPIVIRFFHSQDHVRGDCKDIVREYFLGLLPLEKFDAATLTAEIVKFLTKYKVPLASCICLCFDG